ncbi:MAG: peptidyl-tRNA hydrolase Pth2 [Candidatus Aenigmarchaeota archaeon]|nr:peptidyl-tRNA hydrolase Pth2 [Candidatus Aenigmarchaeota archaeon]
MYKQVIVIRSDLKMSKGKTAAQAAHASLSSVGKCNKKMLGAWEKEGQKKVVLSADMKQLLQLKEKCKKLGIPFALIIDAGMTELSAGSITALGIGPDKEEKINKVTGSLPLLK